MTEKSKILVVDDDPNYVETTVDLMNEKGFCCIGVHSGAEAIDKVKENTFDGIILDVRMPVMNGVETYREIKKISPQSVVIFATAYRLDELVKDALAEDAFALIDKPVDVEQIVKMIEKGKKGGTLIMVVDDDPNTCQTLKDNLEEEGYTVATATDGDQAIRIARKGPQDIVFIDMKLPPVNGLIVYLQMKRVNPHAMAVMMTAHREDMKEMMDEALEQGAHTCLYKPFGIDEAVLAIENITEKKGEKQQCQTT